MSSESIKDIIVKEEYQIQEFYVDYVDGASAEPNIKCSDHLPQIVGTLIPVAVLPPKLEPPDEDESDSQLHSDELEGVSDLEYFPDSVKEKETVKRRNAAHKAFCCYSCGYIYALFETYRAHYLAKHPDMIEKGGLAKNAVCQEPFVPKVPEEMLCKYCLKKFSDPSIFHTHMESAHPEKLYMCPHCPKPSKNDKARQRHINTVHEGLKPYKCPHCPKAFGTKSNFDVHVNTHTNLKPFSCPICDKGFKTKIYLKYHKQTHVKEKAFRCEKCDRSFSQRARLDAHIRMHENIRDQKCAHCEMAFYCQNSLKGHIRYVHTIQRPFSCEICGKTFKLKTRLRDHMQVHSDEKKYACKVCGKKFVHRSSLSAHRHSMNHLEINRNKVSKK